MLSVRLLQKTLHIQILNGINLICVIDTLHNKMVWGINFAIISTPMVPENQRAENGGLDPSWLDSAFCWGAPIFGPEVPKPFRTRILGPLDWKSGRPQNAKSNRDRSNRPFSGLWENLNLMRRDHPNSWKKRSENAGANENLSGGFAAIPGIAPRVAPRIVGFVLIKPWEAIPRMEFCIPRMEFPIPRAAPRIPRNSPRAPRMAFHSESVFPEIGVVPRLLT